MTTPAKKLHSIIYSSFLTSAIIPLIVVELFLLIVYFGITHYISARHREALLTEVTTDLQEIASRETANIDGRLKEVSRLSLIMQQDHEMFFSRSDTCLLPNAEPTFARHANGAWYKTRNNGGSSLYYSSSTTIGPEQIQKARCSEALDPLLKSIVETSPLVTQAYLNTWDNMNRLYPFMSDAPAQYGPQLRMQDYNFYYEADAEHDPERRPIWTGAYLDPAGQGWMISIIVPIYKGNFLEGVSGLDVTIDTFIHHILDLDMPWSARSFLVDHQGRILAMPQQVAHLFGLTELTGHEYTENIRSTIEKPEEFNIFRMQDAHAKAKFTELFSSRKPITDLQLDGTTYLLSQEIVPETGWHLMTMVDESIIFYRIRELRKLTNAIGYSAIFIMFMFYAAFFVFLERKSSRLSQLIAAPIERLTEFTSTIIKSKHPFEFQHVGIEEIDTLGQNFCQMSAELEKRTQELVETRIREQTKETQAEQFERLAITDQLTGIYNRHKLDMVLQGEIDRYKRNHRPFGVMLLDIDHFKLVNDTYGHQLGDQILRDLARLLQTSIRGTDTAGRWGGEEFLLICPETSPEGLYNLAEKLRQTIAAHAFARGNAITVSFGVTMNQLGDSINDIISRADKALYTAKNEGRNRVAAYAPSILH